ncbi:hypothetical protein OF83DRAFT_1159692 [Amylostereum chailletii]|nr:hypothetical protein OF83DRAFT_1159692 [Amylostereum chailletii]
MHSTTVSSTSKPSKIKMSDSLSSHISNVDGNWGTMSFRMASLTAVVTSIHFVAHENTDNVGGDGQSPTNHWTLFLKTRDSSPVHLDVYVFARMGEGCRYWLYTFAYDLVEAGIISVDDADTARAALGKYWPYPAGTEPRARAMAEGTFY